MPARSESQHHKDGNLSTSPPAGWSQGASFAWSKSSHGTPSSAQAPRGVTGSGGEDTGGPGGKSQLHHSWPESCSSEPVSPSGNTRVQELQLTRRLLPALSFRSRGQAVSAPRLPPGRGLLSPYGVTSLGKLPKSPWSSEHSAEHWPSDRPSVTLPCHLRHVTNPPDGQRTPPRRRRPVTGWKHLAQNRHGPAPPDTTHQPSHQTLLRRPSSQCISQA